MKAGFLFALALAIAGQVLYHVTQKSVAPGANPVVSLLAFYGVAAVLSLPLFFLYPMQDALGAELGKMNWAVFGVAVSIVMIELAFLLAYRAGAELSTSFAATASIAAVSTLVIGALFFNESISFAKVGGIALCLAGVALITMKPGSAA
jgi:drug/metabolite transporter (DMT)-like permease